MKRLILFFALIGIVTSGYTQSNLLWSMDFEVGIERYFSEYPIIDAVADTINVMGRKNIANGQRLAIVKYDLLGNTISTKTYGNDSVSRNKIIDYKFDTLGHVYILNRDELEYAKYKMVLQKYALNGDLVWVEQIQSPNDISFNPFSLGIANDDSIFITAYKNTDYPTDPWDDVDMTIRTPQLYAYDMDGDQLWYREFDRNTEIEWFSHSVFLHQNEVFLFANANKLIKVDFNNNLLFNDTTGILNGINDIQVTPDNNLLITALSYRISKIDLTGTLLWTRHYGANSGNSHETKATVQDSDGNIYTTGRHYGANEGTPSYTNADILTVKYNTHGSQLWQNRYEYGGNNADIGNTISIKNGQVYVGGNSQSADVGSDYDYVVLKMDSDTGGTTGVYRYNGPANGHDSVSSLYIFDNANLAVTGLSYNNTKYDWTTQLLSDITLSVQDISLDNKFLLYPNPIANGELLTIEGSDIKSYSIVSSLGKKVQDAKLGNNDIHSICIDNLASGMYFLHLQTDSGITTKKLIVK